ncbi:unnamed protein product [Amoebophrya sp. A120]|nr:unnamed protein product [Amoebophrya sp. A120]|eukprot:GSA120T00006632001.1
MVRPRRSRGRRRWSSAVSYARSSVAIACYLREVALLINAAGVWKIPESQKKQQSGAASLILQQKEQHGRTTKGKTASKTASTSGQTPVSPLNTNQYWVTDITSKHDVARLPFWSTHPILGGGPLESLRVTLQNQDTGYPNHKPLNVANAEFESTIGNKAALTEVGCYVGPKRGHTHDTDPNDEDNRAGADAWDELPFLESREQSRGTGSATKDTKPSSDSLQLLTGDYQLEPSAVYRCAEWCALEYRASLIDQTEHLNTYNLIKDVKEPGNEGAENLIPFQYAGISLGDEDEGASGLISDSDADKAGYQVDRTQYRCRCTNELLTFVSDEVNSPCVECPRYADAGFKCGSGKAVSVYRIAPPFEVHTGKVNDPPVVQVPFKWIRRGLQANPTEHIHSHSDRLYKLQRLPQRWDRNYVDSHHKAKAQDQCRHLQLPNNDRDTPFNETQTRIDFTRTGGQVYLNMWDDDPAGHVGFHYWPDRALWKKALPLSHADATAGLFSDSEEIVFPGPSQDTTKTGVMYTRTYQKGATAHLYGNDANGRGTYTVFVCPTDRDHVFQSHGQAHQPITSPENYVSVFLEHVQWDDAAQNYKPQTCVNTSDDDPYAPVNLAAVGNDNYLVRDRFPRGGVPHETDFRQFGGSEAELVDFLERCERHCMSVPRDICGGFIYDDDDERCIFQIMKTGAYQMMPTYGLDSTSSVEKQQGFRCADSGNRLYRSFQRFNEISSLDPHKPHPRRFLGETTFGETSTRALPESYKAKFPGLRPIRDNWQEDMVTTGFMDRECIRPECVGVTMYGDSPNPTTIADRDKLKCSNIWAIIDSCKCTAKAGDETNTSCAAATEYRGCSVSACGGIRKQ